jgi:hypothetical protein
MRTLALPLVCVALLACDQAASPEPNPLAGSSAASAEASAAEGSAAEASATEPVVDTAGSGPGTEGPSTPPAGTSQPVPARAAVLPESVVADGRSALLAQAAPGSGAYSFEPPAPLIDTAALRGPLIFPAGRFYSQYANAETWTNTPEPTPLETTNLILQREPWVEVAEDGNVTIRWETRDPEPGGAVYWGITMPDQRFAQARYRKSSRESLEAPATEHSVTFRVRSLEDHHYDVSHLADGGGVIEYRVDQRSNALATSRLYDRRFAYEHTSETTVRRVPTVIEGPFVDYQGGGTFVVSFDVDHRVLPAVVWSASDGQSGSVLATEAGTHFELALPQLPPDVRVAYQILLRGHDNDVFAQRAWDFGTQAGVETPVRFAVMSDSRSGYGSGEASYEGTNLTTIRRFFADSIRQGAQFIVFPGDLADGYVSIPGDLELQYGAWKDSSELAGRMLPIFEGMGNHDVVVDAFTNGVQRDRSGDLNSQSLFSAHFVNPTNGPTRESEAAPAYGETVYSWDWGAHHFVMLNTNYWWTSLYDVAAEAAVAGEFNREGYLMDEQMRWLDADLAAARARGMQEIILFAHEPPFPNGGHTDDAMYWRGNPAAVARRDELVDIMLRHRVTAIFTGDEHNYSRTRIDSSISPAFEGRTWSIVTGGCGAPYYAHETGLPWSDNVEYFSGQQHYVLVDLDGSGTRVQVFNETGELMESAALSLSE